MEPVGDSKRKPCLLSEEDHQNEFIKSGDGNTARL